MGPWGGVFNLEAAFLVGTGGESAGVRRDSGVYRSVFFGFPFFPSWIFIVSKSRCSVLCTQVDQRLDRSFPSIPIIISEVFEEFVYSDDLRGSDGTAGLVFRARVGSPISRR